MTKRTALLPAAVSLACLGAVAWWAVHQKRPDVPDTAGALAALALSLALYTVASLARAERWHQILRRGGAGVDRGESYRLTAVGYMGNNTLPARGGDLLRVFLVAPLAHTSRRAALGTVVAERLLDALALGVIFVAVAYGVLDGVTGSGERAAAIGAVAGGAVLCVAAAVVVLRRAPRAREFLRPLAESTRNLRSAHGAALLALSLAVWTLEAGVYLTVAHATDVDLGVAGALYVVALTNLSALVPAGPGYVGTFDAAVILAVRSLGNGGSAALGYLILLRFVLFVPITLVGFAFFLARYRGSVRRARIGRSLAVAGDPEARP